MDDRDLLLDDALDDALDGMPLAPTPPGFTRRVMTEIWRPALSFRFEFLDLVLSAFFALCVSALAATAFFFALRIDPLTWMTWKLHAQLLLLRWSHWPGAAWAALAAALGAALLVGLAALLAVRASERR